MIRFAALALILSVSLQDAKPAWRERIEKHSKTAEAWAARKAAIREQILVAAGLWPEFERPALKPFVFGKVEGEGYTVERVQGLTPARCRGALESTADWLAFVDDDCLVATDWVAAAIRTAASHPDDEQEQSQHDPQTGCAGNERLHLARAVLAAGIARRG